MPLDFHTVYRLWVPTGNYFGLDMVVAGVRWRTRENPLTWEDEDCVEFITNSVDKRPHDIFGDVILDEGGVVEIQDQVRRGENADVLTVVWRFEPLTLDNWALMPIISHADILPTVPTDHDLQLLYYHNLPDYWIEQGP